MPEKPHILIVDDEPLVLASLSDLLEFDYTVHTAGNPHEALSLIAGNLYPFKVIMSDQRMPGMYGHEFLREAKKLMPNTIRLLLTGYSDLESIMYSVNVGEIFRYINKPWKSQTILNVFRLAVKLHDQMEALDKSKSKPKTEPEKHQPTEVSLPTQKETVLFIGYSSGVVNHYANILSTNYEVHNVQSTAEAIDDLKHTRISVIVSEINIGYASTLDFLIKIKKDFPNVVTIMLTKSIDANFAIRAINDLNVFRYLTPPVDDANFKSIIDQAAKRSEEYREKLRLNVFEEKNKAPVRTQTSENAPSDLRSNLKAAQALLSRKHK